jgi:hypothetical protein
LLTRLTFTVWLAWLGMLGLMVGLLVGFVPHPHFLPMTALLAILIVAGLALIGGAGWRLIRGPNRGAALTCLLLGFAPLGFTTGHILYGLKIGQGRQITRTLPIRLLIPFGESIFDLEARFRYPVRTLGAKVVMISKPDNHEQEQVAAMDRHVRALEARLGRPMIGKVHWARGPLFGMQGKAIFGLCMGSRAGENPLDSEGLTELDRHEVAHCVITSLCNAASDPPSVLSEGWAQANCGHDPVTLARQARGHLDSRAGLSLRELTGPDWYNRHHWPAYVQGAALVNYLLRTYGPERFLTLYATCTRPSFARDCERILGISLDELDAGYRADIDRILALAGPLPQRQFERIRIGPDVDAAAWKAFLVEYLAAAEVLLAPYQQVAMIAKVASSTTNATGITETSEEEVRFACSDRFRCYRLSNANYSEALLAHPERSFEARKERPSDPWEIVADKTIDPAKSYRRITRAIEGREYVSKLAAILLAVVAEENGRVTVTKLERFSDAGRPRVRVRLEGQTRGDQNQWFAFTAVLSPADHFAAQSDVIEDRQTGTLRREYVYDRHNGLPVLRELIGARTQPNGEKRATRITVVDRRFGPVPESEFTRERLLEGSWIEKAADPEELYGEEGSFADWYAVPLIAGAVSLLIGAATGLFVRKRHAMPCDSGDDTGGKRSAAGP